MSRGAERVDWLDGRARCAKDGVDPEMFFELENAADDQRFADPLVVAEALALCERCPLLDECFHRAVYSRSLGIWGGTTAEERGHRYTLTRRSRMEEST